MSFLGSRTVRICRVIDGARFNSFRPQCVIIDEANQLVDPELLSVLRFNPDQLTLYEDHTQIGPFSHLRKARQCGYALSLIERIWKISADGVQARYADSAVPNAPGARRVPVQRILPELRQECRHQRTAKVLGSLSEPGRPTSARDGTSRRRSRSQRSLIGCTRAEYRWSGLA
jgi:hypothetical protein